MVDSSGKSIDFALATTFWLTLVVVVSSHVADKVHWPAEKLLADGVDNCGNWRLLGQLMNFVNEFSNARSIIFASLGDENHVPLHVSSCLVMLAVGDFP